MTEWNMDCFSKFPITQTVCSSSLQRSWKPSSSVSAYLPVVVSPAWMPGAYQSCPVTPHPQLDRVEKIPWKAPGSR